VETLTVKVLLEPNSLDDEERPVEDRARPVEELLVELLVEELEERPVEELLVEELEDRPVEELLVEELEDPVEELLVEELEDRPVEELLVEELEDFPVEELTTELPVSIVGRPEIFVEPPPVPHWLHRQGESGVQAIY
jgi:hypothetical protein